MHLWYLIAVLISGLIVARAAESSSPAASTPVSVQIVSEGAALIQEADIKEYLWANHSMKVTGDSWKRLNALRLPLRGQPFQVLVNGEPVYSGLLVPVISSMTYKQPTIWAGLPMGGEEGVVTICAPVFSEPQFQTGEDPRSNPQLSKALAALGKLRAGVPGGVWNDSAFSERVLEVLKECQTVHPGMTREDLLRVFEEEGGNSNPAQGRFHHRSSPYIKVDVHFAPAESGAAHRQKNAGDIIRQISRPYLASFEPN